MSVPPRRLDTAALGPIRIDPADAAAPARREAFKRWWSGICRAGDPRHRVNLTEEAFHAGFAAGAEHGKERA